MSEKPKISDLREFDKSISHHEGINFQFDVEENKNIKVITDTAEFHLVRVDDKLFIQGPVEWCAAPTEVKIFGIFQNISEGDQMEIYPGFLGKGLSMEVLIQNSGETKRLGTVIDHDKISPFKEI